MKIKDIIKDLDKSNTNECDSIRWDMECMVQECNLDLWDIQQEENNVRLRSYWVANHYCTDTYVGYRAYFLDDTFVCLSYQPYRKSDETFEWVSKGALDSVRDFLLSLREEDQVDYPKEYLDMEEDMGEGYKVEYTGQLLRKRVKYKDDMATVLKDSHEGYTNFHNIKIKRDKTYPFEIDVDVRKVTVPWYTNNNKGL